MNPGSRGKQHKVEKVVDLDKVEQLAMQGLSQVQIAQALDISEDSLTRRREDQPGVQQAIDRGAAKGLAVVTDKLLKGIAGDKGFAPGQVQAITYYLNNRAGWSMNPAEQIGDTHNYFVLGPEKIEDANEWASTHRPALPSPAEG